MSIIGSELLMGSAGDEGYLVERSLRFDDRTPAQLTRTPSTTGNRKKFTLSCWLKLVNTSSAPNNLQTYFPILVGGPNTSTFTRIGVNAGKFECFSFNPSTQVAITREYLRECSGWAHLVVAVDSTQATATNRVKVWTNGQLKIGDDTSCVLNSDFYFNYASNAMTIGRYFTTFAGGGYLAEYNFIDGQQLDPTSFGEFDLNNTWNPIKYTGSYGTNGFYLNFSNYSTTTNLGLDSSGNSNNFTPSGFSVTAGVDNDSLLDSPTNGSQSDTGAGGQVSGNYCVWNTNHNDNSPVLKDGNLSVDKATSTLRTTCGTHLMQSGKWYWEFDIQTTQSNFNYCIVGVGKADFDVTNHLAGSGVGYRSWNGTISRDATNVGTGATYTAGDKIGVAYDADNGTVKFYKNGVQTGPTVTGYANEALPAISTSGTVTVYTNFGQRPFTYSAPSGYKTLCTANYAEPSVPDPSLYFDVIKYIGTGSSANAVTGLNFSPDLVWVKRRDQVEAHYTANSVVGATSYMSVNSTAVEGTGVFASFNSNGFTLNAGVAGNVLNGTYVAWAWDVGSSTVTNTNGTISCSQRADASRGVSISTYSGNGAATASVGHGLSGAPDWYIIKRRNVAGEWYAFSDKYTVGTNIYYSNLNRNYTITNTGTNTNTSSVVGLQGGGLDNQSGYDYLMWAFKSIPGYSRFGFYYGNNVTTGVLFHVNCGFRPKFVIIRLVATTSQWFIIDEERTGTNNLNYYLTSDTNSSETTQNFIDLNADGFTITTTQLNPNYTEVFYAAFAESPFKTAKARF